MSHINNKSLVSALLVGALMLVLVPVAMAGGTPSGTPVDNTATVAFSVSGSAQTPVVSNTASFVVDTKIDLTVTTIDGGIVSVVPNTTGQVLTFTVTNDGNAPQDYSLQALASAVGAFGETETFDATAVTVWVDTDDDNAYNSVDDTDTYIDELDVDETITVFVVSSIPIAQVHDDVASYYLVAQTAVSGSIGALGADITSDDSGIADVPTSVQIVFGDGDGPADDLKDGRQSSLDGYKVVSAELDVDKTTVVISDPFNLAVNPKAIPGATVGYQVVVTNIGLVTADNVTVIDSVPAFSSFLVGSVTAPGATVTYSNDGGTTWTHVPVAGANGEDGSVTDIRAIFPSIAAAASAQENFRVLID